MPLSLFLNVEYDRPDTPHKEPLSVAAREQDSHNDAVANDCYLMVAARFKPGEEDWRIGLNGIGHWYTHCQGWAKHTQPRQNVFSGPPQR